MIDKDHGNKSDDDDGDFLDHGFLQRIRLSTLRFGYDAGHRRKDAGPSCLAIPVNSRTGACGIDNGCGGIRSSGGNALDSPGAGTQADRTVRRGWKALPDLEKRAQGSRHFCNALAARMVWLSAPVPQPKSSRAEPDWTASQRRNSPATRRLQRPTYES